MEYDTRGGRRGLRHSPNEGGRIQSLVEEGQQNLREYQRMCATLHNNVEVAKANIDEAKANYAQAKKNYKALCKVARRVIMDENTLRGMKQENR